MSRAQAIAFWTAAGQIHAWIPTTLDRLGKDEAFLESILASTPELLGLGSRQSGIYGPYRVFRQVALKTPSGRGVYPDIVLLTASGHVVVVEVKRAINPELRDRAVIAQIIDYASSFAALQETDMLALLSEGGSAQSTWAELVRELFPGESEPEELAALLLKRMQSGELNLVIACDKIPAGLPEIVRGISSQAGLGFDLDLVEVVPYVRCESDSENIVFVPTTRLATEIVARTAVTVTYREGDSRPSTEVKTSSLEDIAKQVDLARQGINPLARSWTPEEVEEEVRRTGDPTTLRLLEFIKQHGADDQYVSTGKKINATFGFYVNGRRSDGSLSRSMILVCVTGWETVIFYLDPAASLVSEEVFAEFRRRLKAIFGDDIKIDRKEPSVSLSVVGRHLDQLVELLLWYKTQADVRLREA